MADIVVVPNTSNPVQVNVQQPVQTISVTPPAINVVDISQGLTITVVGGGGGVSGVSSVNGADGDITISGDSNIGVAESNGTIIVSATGLATSSQLSALQADVDQNEADSDSADAQLQANIDAETGARIGAVNSLQGQITTNLTNINGITTTLITVGGTATQNSNSISALENGTGNVIGLKVSGEGVLGGVVTLSADSGISLSQSGQTITIGSTGGETGATAFLGLSDTPANYTNASSKAVAVNSGGNGLEFVDFPATGLTYDDFSVGAEGSPSGNGGIAYDNTTGVFTYTPPLIKVYTAGTGITLVGDAFTHDDTSAIGATIVADATTASFVINRVSIDDFGHVIGLTGKKLTGEDIPVNTQTAYTVEDLYNEVKNVITEEQDGSGKLSNAAGTGSVIVDSTGKVLINNVESKAFTPSFETKLTNIEDNAQANVNPDWTASSGDAQILNKPVITENKSNTTGLSVSGDYDANAEQWFFGSGTTTTGQIHYLTSAGGWGGADASASSTAKGMLAFAAGADPDIDGMVLRGFVYLSADAGGNVGDPVYLSETTGGVTATVPTTSGAVVRVVGYKTATNVIYFNPSQDWIDLA